ncbi:hypothetical protein Nepgr_031193 [Nepenthes gracilis]|uniref:Bromo domain-containing protein n=1 Tax=Nepenthes gracilis TaxID=150966 RepID=A0AAD3TGW9_NEPGR|nr:hypothetical protein Nepgr_031193 [Nepenthes gracilis]
MAKGNEAQTNVTWGTLEELLLACAVSRYGTSCWDSVAREIQKRSSGCRLLTPQNCKQKYHELKNRFTARNGYDNNTPPIDGSENGDAVDTCLWQDELRKIRIAELKRELELYDLSIMSLQSKVEKLKEERERSLRENEKEETDLEKSQVRYRVDDLKETKNIPEISSPEQGSGREVSVGESAREKLSVNESNSTDPKGDDNLENRVGEKENDSAAPAVGHINPGKGTARPAGEASYNGSSDTIAPAKEYSSSQNCDSAKADPVKESIDSPELLESVAESKGRREKETKESSDVQSSSSLSRKLRREKVASGGNEPEAENQSLAVKPSILISQPLVDFLEVIRSHKLGSMFERRLECQRTTQYMNLIRQHIDLQTIRTRLDEGRYSDHHANFYRDLLLLINNAVVFFPKKSSEHKAAVELRQLVSKRLPRSAAKQGPEQHLTKREREAEDSLLFKPKISMPVIVCRKRSSTVAKASVGGRKRGEAVLIGNDEKNSELLAMRRSRRNRLRSAR